MNRPIRATLKVDRSGRKSRLRWYGFAKHRDDDYVGRKVLAMRYLDVMKEDMQELGAETICVCPKAMETPLWQALMGKL